MIKKNVFDRVEDEIQKKTRPKRKCISKYMRDFPKTTNESSTQTLNYRETISLLRQSKNSSSSVQQLSKSRKTQISVESVPTTANKRSYSKESLENNYDEIKSKRLKKTSSSTEQIGRLRPITRSITQRTLRSKSKTNPKQSPPTTSPDPFRARSSSSSSSSSSLQYSSEENKPNMGFESMMIKDCSRIATVPIDRLPMQYLMQCSLDSAQICESLHFSEQDLYKGPFGNDTLKNQYINTSSYGRGKDLNDLQINAANISETGTNPITVQELQASGSFDKGLPQALYSSDPDPDKSQNQAYGSEVPLEEINIQDSDFQCLMYPVELNGNTCVAIERNENETVVIPDITHWLVSNYGDILLNWDPTNFNLDII